MKFMLTSYDVFNDGWVKSVFEVEAPSEEVGEYLIKKQISKLFRSFPAGSLTSGWTNDGLYSGSSPITIPNLQPGWSPFTTPNIVGGSTSGGIFNGGVQYGGVLVGGIDNSTVVEDSMTITVPPGATVVINGVAGVTDTFSVTNSSINPMTITNTGCQLSQQPSMSNV